MDITQRKGIDDDGYSRLHQGTNFTIGLLVEPTPGYSIDLTRQLNAYTDKRYTKFKQKGCRSKTVDTTT